MLNIAKAKTQKVRYIHGFAEDLPYSAESFDFVVNNFAFHHFQKKAEVLDEAARVIKQDGLLKIHNISIHDMEEWWIYHFFPSAYYEDLKRYWPKELIFYELSKRNFKVEVKMEYIRKETLLADYMDHIYNRDISVLTIINDEEYNQGVEMMEYRIRKDPETIVVDDFAEISFLATKK